MVTLNRAGRGAADAAGDAAAAANRGALGQIGNVLGAPVRWTFQGGVGRVLMTGGVVIGGYQGAQFYFSEEGQEWINENFGPDAPSIFTQIGDLIERGSEELAQVGPAAQFQGFYAIIEQLGILWNNIMGGDSGLGLINWARDAQEGKPPMAYVNGDLVETVPTTDDTDVTTGISGVEGDLAAVFDSEAFETAFRARIGEELEAGASRNFMNDEVQFERIVLETLGDINADASLVERVQALFDGQDLSDQFNFRGRVDPSVDNRADRVFDAADRVLDSAALTP
ncbi:MAG: hypothetical protein AAGB32_01545 [Pseudomonadota bacterium]